jgi:hypothetical protein
MDPRTIPGDIYRLLENTEGHEVSEDNVEWAGEAFKELLRARLQPRKEGDVIRFSSLGKQPRQLWYQANAPETAEKLQGKQLFKFLYGDAIEILLLFLTKETGHEVTHLQTEVECDGVRGHTDAVIDGVPVDCKSASPYAYTKFEDGSYVFDDPFGYVSQLSGYAHALERTDRAGFLVAEKVAGDICFAPLDGLTIEANPPGPRIAELKEVVKQSAPPERCYAAVPEGKSGNMKLGVSCSYCPFKDVCWADANGGKGLRKYFYSRGPVWLTDVQRDPKVAEAL